MPILVPDMAQNTFVGSNIIKRLDLAGQDDKDHVIIDSTRKSLSEQYEDHLNYKLGENFSNTPKIMEYSQKENLK